MIHELRIYECVPGRRPDLNKRFDTITLKLWEKHGIKQAGFWTTVIGESNQTLYYMLEWESLAERERKWNAFGADPEWLAARAQTEANGAIVHTGRARWRTALRNRRKMIGDSSSGSNPASSTAGGWPPPAQRILRVAVL